MPPAISRTSAIIILADWIQVNGRAPTATECRAKHGLNHYTTYVQLWGGLSQAVSMASMAMTLASTLTYAVVTDMLARVNQHYNQHRQTSCMRCHRPMKRVQDTVRHCSGCRKVLFAERTSDELPGEISPDVIRTLYAYSWDDLLDEAVIHCK